MEQIIHYISYVTFVFYNLIKLHKQGYYSIYYVNYTHNSLNFLIYDVENSTNIKVKVKKSLFWKIYRFPQIYFADISKYIHTHTHTQT